MNTYESTFISVPELPVEANDEFIEKIRKIVENSNGKLTVTQQLGRKRLAYPIKKYREGNYVYMELSGAGEMISALENFYKVNDKIIRYLTVKVEKKKVVKPVTPEKPVNDNVQPVQNQEGKPNESADKHSAPRAE